jgi:hypothetical protein
MSGEDQLASDLSAQSGKGLPCGEGLATHRCVDRIEDAQSVDIRDVSNDDRIASILNLALRTGERRPRG